jgi:hypothetical protein
MIIILYDASECGAEAVPANRELPLTQVHLPATVALQRADRRYCVVIVCRNAENAAME